MRELNKAKQWLQEDIEWMKQNECTSVHSRITLEEATSLLNSLNKLEYLSEKLNRDIKELPLKTSYYYDCGLNQQRAVNLDIKDYAVSIQEIIGD